MKQFLLLAFLLFSFTSQNGFGQDTAIIIYKSWTTLKAQLQRRTDIVANLSQTLSNSKTVDKKELEKLKRSAVDIFQYLDTLTQLDSSAIIITRSLNNKLTDLLMKTLAWFEKDTQSKNRQIVMHLTAQLEGTENRIAFVRKEYNQACQEDNRTDLQYLTDETSQAPQVRF